MARALDLGGLERAAVRHLQRFPCSEDRLTFVLRRRIRRAEDLTEADRTALEAGLPEIIVKMRRMGLVDDAAYARALVDSLHRRGKGRRAIAAKLRERMVPQAQAEAALAHLHEETADPELEAALNYARRRRIGPFHRDPARRAERRDKDLAALGRQGFSYGVARQVVDGDGDGD
ncbi:MAG: RecX family transcriptional regulator [Myxococcales bacterium]|nr:RecX family transcriptional regulator [Myxococcales bacterium]